ncbi:MAG: RNA polymerase sigma factor [Gammaproteobacteria bacterium]|nr:RNA polymerase sigma factor [Gammaproteobacteria bacterium]
MTPAANIPDFAAVAAEHSAALLRYLERQVRDPALAEDLLQETLIRIERGLPAFEGRSGLRTWAFSIATRVAIDHLRRPERKLAIVDFEEADSVVDDNPALDDRMIVDEMNACVREVIDGLPPDYRAALILYDLEGLSAAEVADAIGCTLATAKIRVHRARQRLRDALAKQCNFYRDGDSVFRCSRS